MTGIRIRHCGRSRRCRSLARHVVPRRSRPSATCGSVRGTAHLAEVYGADVSRLTIFIAYKIWRRQSATAFQGWVVQLDPLQDFPRQRVRRGLARPQRLAQAEDARASVRRQNGWDITAS